MTESTDGQLLSEFARTRSEAAFAEIVRRHGGMVYNVCLRVTGLREAAEDAAQAAFAVLARKARRVASRPDAGGWLHHAAVQVARNLRKAELRRRAREKEAGEMRQPSGSQGWSGVARHVDQALARLPESQRQVVVGLYLEGRSRAEMARLLAVPEGTVASRSGAALEKLRRMLRRRGVAVGAAALGAMLAENGAAAALPASFFALPSLAASFAAKGAAGAGGSKALLLAEGTMKAMTMLKIKIAAAVIGAVLVTGGGGGLVAAKLTAGEPRPEPKSKPKASAEEIAKLKQQLVKGGGHGRGRLRPPAMCKLGKLLPPEELVKLLDPYLWKQAWGYQYTEDGSTAALVLGKFAGKKAVPQLSKLLAAGTDAKGRDRAYAAAWALGWAGGEDAAAALAGALKAGEPSVRYRAAKSLGMVGGKTAGNALTEALEKSDRCTRHAAAVGLAQMTGKEGLAALGKALGDKDPLIRRGAAWALLGRKDAAALKAEAQKVWAAPVPPPAYRPRNTKLAALAENTWLKLGGSPQEAGQRETQWCFDEANRLLFRQSGCTGHYSNEAWALDVGTMTFVKRRPHAFFFNRHVEWIAPWRYSCLVGTCYDPHAKLVRLWGGTWGHNQYGGFDLAADGYVDLKSVKQRWAEAYNPVYDPVARRCIAFGGTLAGQMHCWNPHTGKLWNDKASAPGPGNKFPRYPTPAAVYDPVNKVVVCFTYTSPTGHYSPTPDKRGPTETWIYDPAARAWRNAKPKVQPTTTEMWGSLAYDTFNRAIILSVGSPGKKAKLGTSTWRYEVKTNTWTDLKPAGGGPGGGVAYRMSFDPEHNVVVGAFPSGPYNASEIWVYRYKQVPVGTKPLAVK